LKVPVWHANCYYVQFSSLLHFEICRYELQWNNVTIYIPLFTAASANDLTCFHISDYTYPPKPRPRQRKPSLERSPGRTVSAWWFHKQIWITLANYIVGIGCLQCQIILKIGSQCLISSSHNKLSNHMIWTAHLVVLRVFFKT
jgi:hypothetical protein